MLPADWGVVLDPGVRRIDGGSVLVGGSPLRLLRLTAAGTRLVDRLSARGLVTRARSQSDRRVVKVSITAKGLDLLRELDPHAQRMPRALIGHVSAAKLQQLATLLAEVLDGVGTYP